MILEDENLTSTELLSISLSRDASTREDFIVPCIGRVEDQREVRVSRMRIALRFSEGD